MARALQRIQRAMRSVCQNRVASRRMSCARIPRPPRTYEPANDGRCRIQMMIGGSMSFQARLARLVLVPVVLLTALAPVLAQHPAPSSTITPEEQRIYGAFRAWITSQPAQVQRASDDVVMQRYAAV